MKLLDMAKKEFGEANAGWGLDVLKHIMEKEKANASKALKIYRKNPNFWRNNWLKGEK